MWCEWEDSLKFPILLSSVDCDVWLISLRCFIMNKKCFCVIFLFLEEKNIVSEKERKKITASSWKFISLFVSRRKTRELIAWNHLIVEALRILCPYFCSTLFYFYFFYSLPSCDDCKQPSQFAQHTAILIKKFPSLYTSLGDRQVKWNCNHISCGETNSTAM